MNPIAFGPLLKQYRMAAGLTQEALAERANLSARAISDLERGINRIPRYDTLNMLTSAMSLSTDQRASLFAAARPTLPSKQTLEALERPLQVLPLPPTPLIGRQDELAHGLELLLDRESDAVSAGSPQTALAPATDAPAKRRSAAGQALSVEKMKGSGSEQALSAAQEPAPRTVRLLTVTGPGGVGKTRLALQIAYELRDHFADGLAYVDLAPVRDPALVPQVVAQTLGLRERPESPFPEQVRTFLRGKQFLLILDNFEQVLAAAPFVADCLTGCPRLQVLVTSRTPLHLRAEYQLRLAPLTLDAAGALFYERAQRLGIQLPLEHTAYMVAAICEQVDKIPLAIELAAAHVRVLSLPQLLEHLANRLRFLRGGARDLPERQRTMVEAIAWSYDLLDAEQRRTFRALSVCLGGCTLSAAEAINLSQETGAPSEVLSSIMALADASLIHVGPSSDGGSRYFMLETIREYAAEQLRASGEEEQCLRRHAEYFAQLAEKAERVGPGQSSREAQLERESANGRAALQWAYERGEITLGLRLITWFGQFWFSRGQIGEVGLWLERMLELDARLGEQGAPPGIRGKAFYGASRHALHLGRVDRAEAFAREALALAKRSGDEVDVSRALSLLGSTALAAGNEDEAATHFRQSCAAAERGGEARAKSLALLNLGEIARRRTEFERAAEYLEESLDLVRANDMTWGIASTLTLLGHLARQQHDYARAKTRYRESLELFRTLANPTYTAWCMEGVAAVAVAEQRFEHATRLCAAAAALRAAAQTPLPSAEQEAVDKFVMTARAELGEMNFTKEWQIGSSMGQEDSISYALVVLST